VAEPFRSAAGTATAFRVGVATTVGSVREHNEDNFYVPGREVNLNSTVGEHDSAYEFPYNAEGGTLFLVADGMGGQNAGEKASQMAVDIIPKEVQRRLGQADDQEVSVSRSIREAVAMANQEILGLSHIQTEFTNMGTTIVLSYFRNGRVYIAGIGDSRVYRVRNREIQQLTKDHSLADALLEAGTITQEELVNHKFKHVLYLYLGSKDARGGPQEVRDEEVRTGDRFLLASDGLTGVVEDEEVLQLILDNPDPQIAAGKLVSLALDHYSKDNITCLVIYTD